MPPALIYAEAVQCVVAHNLFIIRPLIKFWLHLCGRQAQKAAVRTMLATGHYVRYSRDNSQYCLLDLEKKF